MASNLTDELQRMTQRSGSNTGLMRTEAERASFAINVRNDIASIMYQLNTVYYELAQVLSSTQGLDALSKGISGNVVFTHIDATEADAEAYWSKDQARTRTIKETVDVLLAEIARLENEIQIALQSDEYDDTAVRSLIQGNSLDLLQLARDCMGLNYSLDGDGAANLTWSLSQAVDAIGAMFSGYVASGNTYTSTYPALSLNVLLSNVTIDTTLAQSVITGLPADLGYIRAFIGMSSSGPEMPMFSTYGGSLNTITDGDSLEESIWKLDQLVPAVIAAVTMQNTYDAGSAGVAGNVQLLNAKGPIQLSDDTSSAIGTMLKWVDTGGSNKGALATRGVALFNDAFVEIQELGANPTAQAGAGRYNCRPDATSAKSEAFFQNDVIGDGNAQLTRDGIVKELEVGHTTVRPDDWNIVTGGGVSGPVAVTQAYTGSDMITRSLDYDATTQEYAYSSIPIPMDENGNMPTRVKLVGHYILKPLGGYPGGTGVAFGVQISDSVQNSTLPTKTVVNPGWRPIVSGNAVGLSGANVNNVVVIEFLTQTLTTAPLGLLNVKHSRLVSDPADNWDDDVGLIVMHAIWYR